MASARRHSEDSSNDEELSEGQSEFNIPKARELSEDEASVSQHRLPYQSQRRQAGIANESESESEPDECEFDEEEDEGSQKQLESSVYESSCSDRNECQDEEEESEQGTGSLMSEGGLSSVTSGSQRQSILKIVRNLKKEVDF